MAIMSVICTTVYTVIILLLLCVQQHTALRGCTRCGRLQQLTASLLAKDHKLYHNRQHSIERNDDGVPVDRVMAKRYPLIKIPCKSTSPRLSQGKMVPKERNELQNPNRLRITGGIRKGKKIDSPDVYLRPMMAKVREALFSTFYTLGAIHSDTRVLDVFSGSGSIGLEALSRGAGHATFVDFSSNCISTSLHNARRCRFESNVTGVCGDALDVLRSPSKYQLLDPYNIVLLTPPYEEIVYSELLEAVYSSPLITRDTIVGIEYPVEMGALPYSLGNGKLLGLRNRRYGRTVLALYIHQPSAEVDLRPKEFEKL